LRHALYKAAELFAIRHDSLDHTLSVARRLVDQSLVSVPEHYSLADLIYSRFAADAATLECLADTKSQARVTCDLYTLKRALYLELQVRSKSSPAAVDTRHVLDELFFVVTESLVSSDSLIQSLDILMPLGVVQPQHVKVLTSIWADLAVRAQFGGEQVQPLLAKVEMWITELTRTGTDSKPKDAG
jgi:hypothetical protein